MKKAIFLSMTGCVLLFGLLAAVKYDQIDTLIKSGEGMQPPPETVSSFTVKRLDRENTLSSVGTLESVRGVTLTADIPGRVVEVAFTSGIEVNKGDVLVRQDVSSEQAQLRAVEANLELARANLNRQRDLVKKNVVSASEFDTAEAQAKSTQAEADTIRTSIEKKTITAPFSGRLGIRSINIGQDLSEGAPIVSLQTVDPLFVNFHLPQQHLAVLRTGLTVRVRSDTTPDSEFIGEITAIDAEVDPKTRNIRVQATLANPQQKLLPGMYVTVEVVLDTKDSVTAIPITAVSYATYGDSVFVLEEKDGQLVARQQFVQLGETRGDFVAVKDGVQPGDLVASSGIFKLRGGMPVAINNEIAPSFSTDPDPADK
ncbi:MAG: efflux RND transporter periplasmic adaptor subunit [Gammaproteobacteria bacterium]